MWNRRCRLVGVIFAASVGACCAAGTSRTDGGADATDASAEEAVAGCTTDRDCNDRIACTIDHCQLGACVPEPCADCCGTGRQCVAGIGCGAAPTPCTTDAECADAVACTLDRCRDSTSCEHLAQNGLCGSGEICLAALGCIAAPPSQCTTAADCRPASPCLGDWFCDGEFGCQFGSLLDCDDADACTSDSCDDDAGGCTHAARDLDRDGYGDALCGGTDCDDARAAVHPGAAEVCNAIDDDCDGMIDEGCCTAGAPCPTSCGSTGTTTCNPDGTPGPCAPPAEACNGADDDCDSIVDEGFACTVGSSGSCPTACGSTGSRSCLPDCTWDLCTPPAETCNGADDDCDGALDDGFACVLGSDAACTSSCGSIGRASCEAGCVWGACVPPAESCNDRDDDCDGRVDNGYACGPSSTGSCPTSCGSTGSRSCLADCTWDLCVPPAETCNGVDDDCDGACDEASACCARTTVLCSTLGFAAGSATCRADCSGYDTVACTNCGNGRRDAGESCDGTDLGGNNCTTVPGGFVSGTLRCTSACTFDTSGCSTSAFDPTGIYAVTPGPAYTCAFGLVNFNLGTLTFSDGGSALIVSGSGLPCTMVGSSARTSRAISVTCTAFGTCDETYTLTGTYTDDDHWSGTFTATFTGSCFGCVSQSWSVSGAR